MAITVPNAAISLKGVHLSGVALKLQADMCHFLPASYVFYNSFLLLCVLWSLHQRESEEAPFMACHSYINYLYYLLNVEAYTHESGGLRFSCVMAILQITIRPVSSFLLYRIVQDRAGTYGSFGLPSGLEGIFGTNRRSPYEDIDQPIQSNVPSNTDSENVLSNNQPPESLFTT
ncbi:unnamed protein product, partial [Meganyctiphanes norvegica]